MFLSKYGKYMLATASTLALTGCGGEGASVNSTPVPVVAPTPTPTPTPGAASDILASPATQEFAALSSVGSSSDLRIRFDASTGHYDVLVDNAGWQGLRPSATYHSTPEHYFSYGPSNNQSFFQVSVVAKDAAPDNYQYSSLAVWGKGVGAYWDDASYTAFGVPTGSASMPVNGTATYQGFIQGNSDVLEMDYLIGAKVAATVHGSVALNFDFAAGTLGGSIHPTLSTFGGNIDLGSMSFVNTVYSTGSTTFSGNFQTQVSGTNSFSGLFTGPNAEELIGRWAFPFVYSGDGATHSASGAWIAKH